VDLFVDKVCSMLESGLLREKAVDLFATWSVSDGNTAACASALTLRFLLFWKDGRELL
jgi:hypothetical protein